MNHTFLFKEGLWLAKGDYFDHNNMQFPVEGEVKITFKGAEKLSSWAVDLVMN